MPPKKKLSKKEKARLEAEQAELLRIEMEKEKQRKLEEERQRRQIEYEQAKQRQKEEIEENKLRRAQLKHSMSFFNQVQATIDGIKAREQEERDWEKFMRCNGLPNANSPSDLRKYIHQWQADIERRQRESRNWLLRTNERTMLTQDVNAPNLTRTTLKQQQGNLGDVYARRISEVLGILEELEESIADKKKPPHITSDLIRLKTEIRVFLNDHLDNFAYKTMSHIERDMEIDRPGVCQHFYNSDVFKTLYWTFSKDAQIAINAKARIGEQPQHNEIDFPALEMQIALPPSVQLQSSAMRGLWMNYDHFSDYCATFSLKKSRSAKVEILRQTKKEWHKRKEILQNMLDDCSKETAPLELESPSAARGAGERSFDVDKAYTEYEDEINKARRRAIGPESYGMRDTDVNLRKYRIIAGVYCIDYLEIPEQDKRLNARSFIRTIIAPNKLTRKEFFQTYKPPPPPQPGVRRLPEEIEAEMRMIEAALDKLALVTLQLPDSVIWFEPPIACRWETQVETLETDLIEGVKPPHTATPTEATPLSTNTNVSPLKGSPRYGAKMRKRGSQKSPTNAPVLPVREVSDFDMFDIPSGIDMYGLLKDFVVPRLPQGFCVRWEKTADKRRAAKKKPKTHKKPQKQQKVLFLAKYQSEPPATAAAANKKKKKSKRQQAEKGQYRNEFINADFLDLDEPREFFPCVNLQKVLKFREIPKQCEKAAEKEATKEECDKADNLCKNGKQPENAEEHAEANGKRNGQEHANGTVNSSKTSSNSSRRASEEKTEKVAAAKEVEAVEPRRYMFSQLLADLDHLCELQMPHQQEEALNQISANLTSSASSNATHDETALTAATNDAAEEPSTDALQSPFGYYTGISFLRDADAKREAEAKDAANAAEVQEESSSEYDEEEEDDDDFETTAANLNSLSGAAATGGLRDFLSKHNQSESDSSSNSCRDDKKAKLSNIAALTQGKWSTRDVHDTKFNEDKLSIQFRTGRLGYFGFALNRYSNMPYQTWEIRPDLKSSPGTILFSFTASIVSLDMTITSSGYCVNNFQGGTTDSINNMIGKIISLAELKAILISSAVDIFPDEDTFCYTEGSCEKNYVMEMHLYACMSTLALSHNFSWSRWNLLAGSRSIVLLMRELIEGKKVPYHSTLFVTPLKTAIIECTEVSACFNSAGIAGMQYYADLYQLSQVYALPSSLEKQRSMDALLRDNIACILSAIRPLSFC